jgi:hypothetical protein
MNQKILIHTRIFKVFGSVSLEESGYENFQYSGALCRMFSSGRTDATRDIWACFDHTILSYSNRRKCLLTRALKGWCQEGVAPQRKKCVDVILYLMV